MQDSQFDVAIIGTGGAGMMAALTAKKNGLNVACISKVIPTRSHTIAAQGGINAALGNRDEDDWQYHLYDTVKGGDWLGDQDAIEFMCKNASQAINMLEDIGVNFDRAANGKIDQRLYGGQSLNFGQGGLAHRACYVADRTGHEILTKLYKFTKKNNINWYDEFFALDLIFNDDKTQVIGVQCLDINNGVICNIFAAMVVIATGGYGQTYQTTTSSAICTGDGNAMIMRAGLPLKDMEFIQFHPTGIYNIGILLSEAARSEGAYLLNGQHERFMHNYAPKYLELASRDVISRAITQEIQAGRGAGDNKDYIYLDLRHIKPSIIKEKLPSILANIQKFTNLDPLCDLIPVSPSVHYTMGGIPTNKDCQVLDINNNIVNGLFAIGEAACMSIHGANRLGCNSLLEIIIFGMHVGNIAKDHILLYQTKVIDNCP
ncbi:MAG: FAD-binding protein, partial [Pseudomonadota bacterium]